MYKSPKTLRSIISSDQGIRVFTTISESKKVTTLCEYCANSIKVDKFDHCKFIDTEEYRQMKEVGILRVVSECAIYQPILGFKW